jgi:AcrR family transcriptional regulator
MAGPMQGKATGRRERRKLVDRDSALDAAARLFAESGYNEAGMAEIAVAAGFSVGKLYTLFENKESLFTALVQERLRQLEATSAQALDPEASALDQLRQRCRAALEFYVADPHFSRIFLHEYPEQADGIIQQETQRHFAIIRGYLERAMEAGEIQQEDPEPLAAIVNGLITSLIDLDAMKERPCDADRIMTQLERFVLAPLVPRPD